MRGEDSKTWSRSDMKVRLPNALRDHVYPDASVSCDPRDLADDEAESISYPRLVVEALSDSTDNYTAAPSSACTKDAGHLWSTC